MQNGHEYRFDCEICCVFLMFALRSCISRRSKPIFQQLYERMLVFKLYWRYIPFRLITWPSPMCRPHSQVLSLSFDSYIDATKFKENIKQDVFNEILLWTCHDECIYHCMWRTTNAFVSRNWNVPQFFGKWPFKRFLGIQEPASVLFSFLNLMAHWRMIRKFRREVRSDSPLYYVWHIFGAVSISIASHILFWNIHQTLTSVNHLDLHKWLDLFHHFPYSRLSINWTTWLWFRLFHGIGQLLLHDFEVNLIGQLFNFN